MLKNLVNKLLKNSNENKNSECITFSYFEYCSLLPDDSSDIPDSIKKNLSKDFKNKYIDILRYILKEVSISDGFNSNQYILHHSKVLFTQYEAQAILNELGYRKYGFHNVWYDLDDDKIATIHIEL